MPADNHQGLSSLQYKDCCGGNYYRIGEVNLPQRMSEILDLAPNNVEIITWVSHLPPRV